MEFVRPRTYSLPGEYVLLFRNAVYDGADSIVAVWLYHILAVSPAGCRWDKVALFVFAVLNIRIVGAFDTGERL